MKFFCHEMSCFMAWVRKTALISEMTKLSGTLPERWKLYWDPKILHKPDGGRILSLPASVILI
jgi:hypothetical protein